MVFVFCGSNLGLCFETVHWIEKQDILFHSLCSYFDLCLEREVYVQLLISMVPCFERLF